MPQVSLRVSLLASVVLVSPLVAEEDITELAPILVEASDGVATEGTGSYSTERATVGGRQPVDIRDIPQSITVVTDERLEDANANSLEEAAFVLPNLTTALGDVYTGSLYSRGHEVFTYNIDGAPRPFLSIYGTAPDLVFFDRVELLSGPSGVYQGTGEPVGTLNLVRKRPTSTPQGRASVATGSFDALRGEFDYSAPLNAEATVRGRIIAYADTKNSYVDFVESDREGLSGTLDVDLTDQTLLSFGFIAETQDALRFSGLPTFTDGTLLDVPRETFIGADWNRFESDSIEGFTELEHRFDNGSVLKASARRYSRDVVIRSVLPNSAVDPLSGDFDLLTFARDFEEDTDFVDVNWSSPISAFGTTGEVTLGADYRSTDQTMRQNFDFSAGTQNINTFDPTAIAEPVITFPGIGPGFRLNTLTETQEYGIYAQGRIDLGVRTKLSVGTRYVLYDSRVRDTGRDLIRSDIEEQRFVSNIGLAYALNDRLTAYGGYSDIFQPQIEQRADGSQLDPVEGRQFEVGLKGSFNGGSLTTQTAVFYIEDRNRAVEDPANPGAFLDSGDATTKGFEALLQGFVGQNWMVSGGYTYVDTDRDDDPTSPHTLSLWGRYTVPEGRLQGADLGIGLRYASSFSLGTIKAPSYVVIDAMARYPITETLSAQLSVENLLDGTYYTRVNQTTRGNFYGTPRRLTLGITMRF
ncbi:TonB-dependent siderophore receptor [uncultured Roseobacter sp.]|uniref:TonB-dependent siderophore receptor n=1 Tax=uncultured Roseobacter sp. TaxID=114847 RepID=UPI00260FD486|nr:TonB-dependent siderophore receptor [uncultured Roseobacter sp.]